MIAAPVIAAPSPDRPPALPPRYLVCTAGQFYEALNMATLYKLPCIFVVENNKWAIGMNHPRATGGRVWVLLGWLSAWEGAGGAWEQ